MLDQAFSPQNFRQIYDRENRRGRNVDRRFFPDLVIASASISAASAKVRECRRDGKELSKTELATSLEPLQVALAAARADRDALVDDAIHNLSRDASAKGFQLSLSQVGGPNDTQLYPLVEDAASYFVGKQLQANLARLYKIKPSDRKKIVRQVTDVLSTSFNLMVVRTDISSFYESINRSLLINDLDKDQLLSLASKSHIKCVLMKYAQLSGQVTGIPRGVGVSAYLSELYMRTVDEHIRQIDGITYYARYVDDIIAVFSPTAMDNRNEYLRMIADAVALRGLTLNQAKTKSGPAAAGSSFSFEYLGYDFTFGGGTCDLDLSSKKMNRYKRRVDAAFRAYSRESGRNQKRASRRLVARVKFMTDNTRLANSKGFAFTGIYYNNSELTRLGRLAGLDAYLAYKNSGLLSPSLQNRVCQYSFKDGFLKRPFYQYSTREIAEIVEAWSYEA